MSLILVVESYFDVSNSLVPSTILGVPTHRALVAKETLLLPALNCYLHFTLPVGGLVLHVILTLV